MDTEIDTRTRLVRVAMDLFYRQGYSALGVQEICAQAKVSKSSFYHFFASKEDLAMAVLEVRRAEAMQGFAALLAADLSPLAKIRATFEGMYEAAAATSQADAAIFGCPFGSLGSELAPVGSAVQGRVAGIFDELCEAFKKLLDQAIDVGQLPCGLDSKAEARSILTVMQGLSVLGRIYNSPAEMRAAGDRLLNLILSPEVTRVRQSASNVID